MTAIAPNPRLQKWLVFGAVALAFFFINFSTFASLGVVLFTMAADLAWSHKAAGLSFSFLGLACGLASPLPPLALKWWGGRATMAIGTFLLVAGFALASVSRSLAAFDVAIILVGIGFTFAGNVPGVFWITAWFERGAARAIGIYLMIGALGAACAPPLVNAIVVQGGWRLHWQVMAVAAALIGIACLALVGRRQVSPALGETSTPDSRPPGAADTTTEPGPWTARQALSTWQFVLVAAAHIATMMAVTTTHSMIVPHLVKLGADSAAGSWTLLAISVSAMAVKATTGYLCERYKPKRLVALGLLSLAAGNLLLVVADGPVLQMLAAVAFGAGWGLSLVAATVLPLELFGGVTGPKVLSVVALLTTLGAAGPIGAGWIADRYGTFAPIFVIFAALQIVVAIPIFVMRRPVPPTASPAANATGLVGVAEAV